MASWALFDPPVGASVWFTGSRSCAPAGGGLSIVSLKRGALSGGDGQRSDPVQGVEVVAVPGPAGGEVKRPGSSVAGEPPGDLEQPAAQGPGSADGAVGQADQLCPSEHVVSERAEHRPGSVGVELSGGEVRERLVFEISDDLLDDGVLAML